MYEYDNNWLTAQAHGERIGAHKGLQAGLNHGHSEGYDQGWDECAAAARVQYDRLVEHAKHLEFLLVEARDNNAELREGYNRSLRVQQDWKEAFYSLLTVADPAIDLLAERSELRNKLVFASLKKKRELSTKGVETDLVSNNDLIKKACPKVANAFGNWFGRLLAIADRSEKSPTPNLPRAS